MKKALLMAVVFTIGLAQTTGLELVGPGAISMPGSHDDYFSLAPDGQSAVFTRLAEGYRGGTIHLADLAGGRWQNVRIAPFSGMHQDSRASFSPDGRRIVFASNRPAPGREGRTDLDLWMVERSASGWSEPARLGAPVNTDAHETHPSLAASGAIYFVRRTQDSDIWMAPATSGGWGEPARLPDTVNSARPDSHVFVDPAERYVLFAREEPGTGDDVFVSVRRSGAWSAAVSLGAPINTANYEYSAKIYGTPAMLYFTRNGIWNQGGPADIFRIPVSAVPALVSAGVGKE
jgi:Tol biopolymer transport system component